MCKICNPIKLIFSKKGESSATMLKKLKEQKTTILKRLKHQATPY